MKLASDLVEINKEYFSVSNGIIYFKHFIPLWKTIDDNLDDYSFAYYNPKLTKYPDDDPDYYFLVCIDGFGDNYNWGKWDTEESLLHDINDSYDIEFDEDD